MAVINQYKFYGVTVISAKTATLLSPLISETIIIKSLHVTNKSGSNTPTITITNNGFQVINTQTLSTAASVEILTNPMVVEGNTVLTFTTAGTVTDGVDITISYLNIKKEVTV
jgi:hypothetical protein